ncbi:anhydro-N-acetylmuramic acid kinase [bacterium SCSIO 12643]|nr:anhydro-N-acetylmuramic acid kinase [bacterium SCSIO 12643]
MKYSVIGLMSGTSMDGLDLAWCEFEYQNGKWGFDLKKAITLGYDEYWENKLRNARELTDVELNNLDLEYGEWLAHVVQTFIRKNDIKQVDFIASHGHTIHHRPEEGITVQIGNGEIMSEELNAKVVYDFRIQDVLLGGQGAPLVPIGDQMIFYEYESCLNLGGFANISFEWEGQRVAFDICPVNIVMNHFARKLGKKYDKGGELAQKGKLLPEVLSQLNDLEYYDTGIPKSLGIEWVEKFVSPILTSHYRVEDVLRTFVEHIVIQIDKVLRRYNVKNLMITGGGAFNSYLIQKLKEKSSAKITVPEDQIVDFKEALIFAFLGVLKVRGEVNVLKSVTGASQDHSSGKIAG